MENPGRNRRGSPGKGGMMADLRDFGDPNRFKDLPAETAAYPLSQ